MAMGGSSGGAKPVSAVPAPKMASASIPDSPAAPPPVEKRPPPKDDPKPPEAHAAVKITLEDSKEAREKSASELLEKARALEEKSPGDFVALMQAFEAAEEAARQTGVSADAEAAKKAVTERWSVVIDAELRKLGDAADAPLKKNDFAFASAAIDRDKVPEALRVSDWEQRLARTRKPVLDAAEAAAAKIFSAARLAAGAGDDSEKLEKAAAIAAQAEAVPVALAPSSASAAQAREKWLARAAVLKKSADQNRAAQLATAREKLKPTVKKLMQMLKDSSFVSVVDFVEKQRADPANADVREVLKREKEDLQSLLALRQAAFEALKKKSGEKVRLHNRKDIMQATIKESTQPNRLTLVLAQGSTDVGPESLEALDVLALVPPREDNADLKSRALLQASAGDLVAARELFNKARDAGHADSVALYTDYFEALDGGDQELAAKKAWVDAEKLFEAKKPNDAREAYLSFQKQFAKTKTASELAAKLKERLASFESAVAQGAGPGPGLIAEYSSAGVQTVQRIDPKIDFNWGDAPPAAGIAADQFTVTWKGQIKIEREGEYTFSAVVGGSNCSVMFSIKNKNLINQDFSAVTRRIARDDIELEAGVYPITLTYTQTKGPAQCVLKWAVAGAGGHGDRIIPPEQFLHEEGKPEEKKEAKGTYLSDMDEKNVKMGFGKFGRNGDLTIESRRIRCNNVEYAKGLYMRPAHRGSASVTYDLDGDYSVFKTRVALDDFSPGASGLTFKVFGDGKLLWTSESITQPRRHQECSLDVKGVENLEIRVEAKDSSQDGHAVWLDPQVYK